MMAIMQDFTFHHCQLVGPAIYISCMFVVLCVTEPLQHANPIELFHWLPKEHMCILVYLV